MKKVFSILIILCATVISQAQTKVAHINSSELIELMPETDTISMKLEKIRQTWETLLTEKQKEFSEKNGFLRLSYLSIFIYTTI